MAPTKAQPACRCSLDCRSVLWHGERFSFTKSQAAVVKMLWAAWQNGTPDLGSETMLSEINSNLARLRDMFRSHPAFGSMIIAGETKGAFRLDGDPSNGEKVFTQNSHVRSPGSVSRSAKTV